MDEDKPGQSFSSAVLEEQTRQRQKEEKVVGLRIL